MPEPVATHETPNADAPPGGRSPSGVRRVAVFAAVLFVVAGFLGHAVYLQPLPRYVRDSTPANVGIGEYEEVTLHVPQRFGRDIALESWYIPGDKPETVITLHGRGDSKAGMLPIVAILRSAGYSVFALEFRGHGTSGGTWSTSGGTGEQHDAVAAIDWVEANHGAPIALFGYSMGGCVALEVAARDTRVLGVATEGAVADQPYEIHRHFAPVSYVLIPPAIPWIALRTGGTPWSAQPVKRIGGIAPRPVFLIHSKADGVIGVKAGRDLYAASNPPHEYWELEDASHIAGVGRHPLEYRRRLVAFYDKVFAGSNHD